MCLNELAASFVWSCTLLFKLVISTFIVHFGKSNELATSFLSFLDRVCKKMGRQPCCDKVGLKRGPWTIEEDHKLMNFILNNGIHCWRMVPKLAGLLRCGKSCRLRWINYLRPDLKRGAFTEAEEDQIIHLHSCLGNRWSKIASHFPGRTDNEIKNHWNTRIIKRLKLKAIEPKESMEENKDIVTDISTELVRDNELEPKQLQGGNNGLHELSNEANLSAFDETSDVLKDYDLFSKLDLGAFMLNQGVSTTSSNNTSATTTATHSSFSVEESSYNPSIMGDYQSRLQQQNCLIGDDQSLLQQQSCLQQWIESVDSMLSWDGFNNLEQDLFFF